jgi:hypothetical protein
MENNKNIVVSILLLVVVGVGGYFSVDKNKSDVKLNTYATQEDCETSTGKECVLGMCDLVPEGKKFEDVCPNGSKFWMSNEQKDIKVDESVTWKTYTNSQYGFEFKYPESIVVTEAPKEYKRPNEILRIDIDSKISIESKKKMMEELAISGGGIDGFSTFLQISYINSKVKPTCEIIDAYSSISFSKFYLDGLFWDKCISYGDLHSPLLSLTYAVDGDNYFKIYAEDYSPEINKEVDEIISTFEFTK